MLRVYDIKTGKEIKTGDTVTDFRGDKGTFEMATRTRVSGKSGKVLVNGRECYDKCYGLEVLELRVCPICKSEDNKPEARYCKNCGKEL